jgi:release factor glutamine methyltransferase
VAVTPGMSSAREALTSAVDALRAAGVADPRLDAELLLAVAAGWERVRFAAEPDIGVPPGAARRFGEMVRRRLRREPVAYILGRKGFRHIELEVDSRVLIPRPETELLVELALELMPRRVLDVGTGSGAVALAIADELPGCEVLATDTSGAALEIARANAERLGLADRIDFHGTMLPLDPPRLDLVVANLPYVAETEWAGLEPEVTEWEPREALLGGPDGLDVIRAAIPLAAAVAPALALEVGAGQAAAVGELLFEAGFGTVETRPDLAGIPRVVGGKR